MISIIIVNYNAGELLRNCVESIIESIDTAFEIIVYDNHSNDGSVELLRSTSHDQSKLTVISGAENLGFARANNRAVASAQGRYLHFLNPDMIVNRRLNEEYASILKEDRRAIFVNPLCDASGTLLKNRHLVPRINNVIRQVLGMKRVAFWNLGASVMIHREAFNALGGWPEDYFMYAEDLDFFYKAYLNDIPVEYLSAPLTHFGKGITHKIWSDRERAAIIEKSFRVFYRKYHASWEYFIIRPVQLLYLLIHEPGSFLLYFRTFVKSIFISRN